MAGFLATLILCGCLSAVHSFPEAVTRVAPTVAPVVHTPIPLALAKSNNPYYNNPYYKGNNPYYDSQYFLNRSGPVVPIVSYSSEHVGDGTYAFSFATGDGKQAQESGFLKDAYIDNAGNPQGTQVVQGSFAYVSPEGTPIQVSYTADENGFRPSGVHIPADGKAPVLPIPFGHSKDRLYDPLYNRHSPYNYRNTYNNVWQYNRPNDQRYPFDPIKYNPYNNRYNPYLSAVQKKIIEQESNKASVE